MKRFFRSDGEFAGQTELALTINYKMRRQGPKTRRCARQAVADYCAERGLYPQVRTTFSSRPIMNTNASFRHSIYFSCR